MRVLKKISPLEFRVSGQNLIVPSSVENYFDNFRLQLIFSRLFFWFFRNFGLYFFLRQIRRKESFLFLQLYYYRLYNFSLFLNRFQNKAVITTYSGFFDTRLWLKKYKKLYFSKFSVLNTFLDLFKKKKKKLNY